MGSDNEWGDGGISDYALLQAFPESSGSHIDQIDIDTREDRRAVSPTRVEDECRVASTPAPEEEDNRKALDPMPLMDLETDEEGK